MTGGRNITCAEFEVLYCDLLDGVLREPERSAVERHTETCAACAQLAADVRGAVSFLERAEKAAPPAELLTRILHEIPSVRPQVERRSWIRRIFGAGFDKVLQPRFAMGMAMTVLSFSMLARFTGIQVRQLRPSDLDPAKIWLALDDRAHRVWDRAMKYYDNARVVIEIQSRLKEWSEQEQAQQQRLEQQKTRQPAPRGQQQ